MLLIFIKLIGILFCIYGSTDVSYPEEYVEFLNKSIFFRFQYLTIIGLYMTLLTVSLLILDQIVTKLTNKSNQILKQITHFLIVVVLPIELLITIVFWALYLYDPKTIVNEILIKKNGISLFQNICMHVIPAVLLLLEIYFIDVKRDNMHVVLLCAFSTAYYLFLRYVAMKVNRWPYPFLEGRNEITRIFIFIVLTLFGVAMYEICMICIAIKTKSRKNKRE